MIERKIEYFRKYSDFNIVNDYENEEITEDTLADKDDLHVLKAACKSKCSVLLTHDKGFKGLSLLDLNIIAKKADDFFCELFDKHEKQMMDVINRTRKGVGRQRGRDIDLPKLIEMMKTGRLVNLAKK